MSATWPPTTHGLTHTQISERFQRRQTTLQQACEKYKQSTLFQQKTKTVRMMTVAAHWPVLNVTVHYCPIQKTGSTTWSHLLHDAQRQLRTSGVQESSDRSEQSEEVKFLFVREPYSRLLSGYVDKLFSPNTLFWQTTGRYIIQNFRPNATQDSLRCGHDVTFAEYARYVIHSQKTLRHRNGHFIPTHDHCHVCSVNYTYIGHLETLGEDMDYLLNVTHLAADRTPNNFDNRTIVDNARWVLRGMREKITTCISMYEACLRLWKKWHIRGIISKREALPLTEEEAETITFEDFVELSFRALLRSGSKDERKRQKSEALREAFAAVPLEDRLQVQSMLTLDFALFGFDSSPEAVFPTWPVKRNDSYSYLDLREIYPSPQK